MVQPITLSKTEKQLVKQHYLKAGNRLIRERAHCVLLSHQGRGTNDISAILMRKQATVRLWIAQFHETRMASLFSFGYTENENASKLTRAQKQEIEDILARTPEEQGLSGEFWSVASLKDYVTATYDVEYESVRSYHHLFTIARYSFKQPSPFDKHRDDAFVAKRMAEICKEIKPYLASDDWVVLCADETRVNWETIIRRAWLPRGERTVLKVTRNKTGQSYFGALNQQTGKHHCIPVAWQNSATIIEALETLIKEYPNKKVCIIWDNASWHRSKQLREKLAPQQSLERVHLINLPPYAPDENPEEHVWKVGKDAIANATFTTFAALKEQFVAAVTKRTFAYTVN